MEWNGMDGGYIYISLYGVYSYAWDSAWLVGWLVGSLVGWLVSFRTIYLRSSYRYVCMYASMYDGCLDGVHTTFLFRRVHAGFMIREKKNPEARKGGLVGRLSLVCRPPA